MPGEICRRRAALMLTILATIHPFAAGCGTRSPVLSGGNQATASEIAAAQNAVRALLQTQVDAWNRGDLQGFLEGYSDSSDLMFFSNGRTYRGRAEIEAVMRERYKQGMGRVWFGEPRFALVTPDAAAIFGEWRVQLPNGQERSGLGTAVVRKINGQWRIVHDHSSFAPLGAQ